MPAAVPAAVPTTGTPDLAAAATLFADPSRARMVTALLDGRALPASVLASESGVSASTASEHLTRLVAGGALAVERSGRHRYYRLAGPGVADAVEALAALAPRQPVRSLRESTRAEAMRRARTCYDHLAGRVGVAVTEALTDHDALRRTDGGHGSERVTADRLSAPAVTVPYRLGPAAADTFARLGVDLPALQARPRSARPLLRCCVDWSEQRYHLAGALGAAVLTAFGEAGWLARHPGARTVHVTAAGESALRDRHGVTLQPAAPLAS